MSRSPRTTVSQTPAALRADCSVGRTLSTPRLSRSFIPTVPPYVAAFDRAADEAVEAGFWLEPEAEHFKAAARQISFG
jgi:hypothetical protein